uniref:Endoplasmic reticulum vesicle transporter C-terminal domain-containing protein n=1 Tax=Strigamia maritima TaxID=126957 RepID=T1JCT3_STRMM
MLRNRKATLNFVRELDAFSKISETYQETRTSGAAITIICFGIITALIYLEITYFLTPKIQYKYDVDTDYDGKLKINIDMTVAMTCDMIGADILDVTNQNTHSFGHLDEEPTWFELSPQQRIFWDSMKHVNTYIREEHYTLHTVLWTSRSTSLFGGMPLREVQPDREHDACRLHGTLFVNKVAGNFHITAGKSIPHPRGHAHLSLFLRDEDYNFTHRIEHFSFGDPATGIIDPLDGDEKIALKNYQIYQYFIQIVPTHVDTTETNTNTYQYSVTEQDREVNHGGGSHGVPGIYFKYDMSSIKVHVQSVRQFWSQFLVRLCAIVGGVFATSGIINILVSSTIDIFSCRLISISQNKISTPN